MAKARSFRSKSMCTLHDLDSSIEGTEVGLVSIPVKRNLFHKLSVFDAEATALDKIQLVKGEVRTLQEDIAIVEGKAVKGEQERAGKIKS